MRPVLSLGTKPGVHNLNQEYIGRIKFPQALMRAFSGASEFGEHECDGDALRQYSKVN